MRRLLFFIVITAMGMGQGLAQSLIQTYVDRCTGQVSVFTVPMNGSTTVAFYNRSRTFTSQQFQNGELQNWLEETYLWWTSLSPCSTATTGAVATQQQTQQTTQQATQAATNAAQNTTTNVPPTTSSPPPTTQTSQPTTTDTSAATNNTGTTNTSTSGTNAGSTGNDTSSTGGSTTGETTTQQDTTSTDTSSSETTQSTNETSDASTSETTSTEDSSTETTTEDTSESTTEEKTETEEVETEESSTEESKEESKEETKEESKDEESDESKEEDSEEKSDEEESTDEESEEDKEEDSEEKKDDEDEKEDNKKKKKKRALAPPIISANVLSQQSPLGGYDFAASFGVSQSSLMGDKTYGLNALVYSNGQQYMLTANYSQVHINKEGRISRVYSASLGGMKMFTTYMGMMNHSVVFLGKKGSAAGFAFGTSLTSVELDVRGGLVYYDEIILGTSLTGFYTKPIQYSPKLTITPMVAISAPFASAAIFHGEGIQFNKDLMFIGGPSFTYKLTQRFGFNFGATAITATIKDFPILMSYMIGGRMSF